ncbi:hypothetical protein SMD20_39650 [Nonomuraea sp. LP-02]|uniref:hypothetical protein n=1 Tax=Nonomuraea sp. LP-02 TaxID=3097960 RepID=UPI002E353E4C|nr:hypothetical protein [Nonomuraea sp. LP-02]MED7930399.1 hypothetical protein [Nonomuraea sp. LP-02]
MLDGFAQIRLAVPQLLRPSGVVAVTVHPYRHRGELVELPSHVQKVAQRGALVLTDRIVCLPCGLGRGELRNRASFFQLVEACKGWARGLPIYAAAYEGLRVFRKPPRTAPWPASSARRFGPR